jgi:hypothetical protein
MRSRVERRAHRETEGGTLSIQRPSTNDPVTVYVELIDEGTRCIRPTLAEPRDDGSYLLMATANYDPEDERVASRGVV